jgi:acetyl-CoA decarbonylase/synthase complex subunit delta
MKTQKRERKLTLADLAKMLEQYNVVELEDVTIKGDVKLEFGHSVGLALPPALAHALQSLTGVQEEKAVEELLPASFDVARAEWAGEIKEVTVSTTSADGGTRERKVTIGGEKSLPFYNFDGSMPHPPVIAVDCFDMPLPLARAVKEYYKDVMDDPGEWAKKNVREFSADRATIHLISTYSVDITGGMVTKVKELIELVRWGIEYEILNGASGNIKKALTGQRGLGTRINSMREKG